MIRRKGAVAAALALAFGACSTGELSGGEAVVTGSDAPAVTTSPTIPADAANSTTPISIPSVVPGPQSGRSDRAADVLVAAYADGALWEISREQPRLVASVSVLDIASIVWSGADRNLIYLDAGTLQAWNPTDGVIAEVACDCLAVVADDDTVYAVTSEPRLLGFDAQTLAPGIDRPIELPVGPRGTVFPEPIAVWNGVVTAVIGDPAGIAAAGGPQQLWTIDVASGATSLFTTTEALGNTAGSSYEQRGSQVLVTGWGVRTGLCLHEAGAWLLDLQTGEIQSLGPVIPGDYGDGDGFVHLAYDGFWNGPVPYVSAVAAWSDDEPGQCDRSLPSALYRYDVQGDRWQLVDRGPFDSVRPLGPAAGHKVVALDDGRLFVERDGAGELVGGLGTVLASTMAPIEIDLAPPNRPLLDPIVVAAPRGPLAGVPLGTPGDDAEASLIAVLGAPDLDSGWTLGCPLDGDALDTRSLTWGSVRAFLDRSDDPGGMGRLTRWAIVDGSPDDPVLLPAGVRLGDDIMQAANRMGIPIGAAPAEQTASLPIAGGLTLFADGDGAIVDAWIPGPVFCE